MVSGPDLLSTALADLDRGRFESGLRLLDRAVLARRCRTDLAHTVRASVLRQRGRHAAAEPADIAAAASTVGWIADLARAGLVADRVGRLDLAGARARLASCGDITPQDNAWGLDPLSVHRWVTVEVALLGGDATAAVPAAAAAVARARAWPVDAPRRAHHLAKGLLFLAVSQRMAGDAGAAATAQECLRLAESAGLGPLLGPARAEVAAHRPVGRGPLSS